MTERVLLTGGGGFIGSHVLRHLLAETSWELVVIDSFRHRGETDRIVEQARDIPGWRERCHVLTHDLRAPLSTGLAAAIGRIDYCLNVASESSVDRSIATPREFCENNLALALSVLEWARGHEPLRKIIQVSTDEVYGPAPEAYRHREGEAHRPSNPYAASKAAQEDLAYAWWRTYGLPLGVINCMNVFGQMQDFEKFVPMVIRRVLSGERVTIHAAPLPAARSGYPAAMGEPRAIGSRFYLHARNLADALLHLLRSVDFPAYGAGEMARYNVVGEAEVSNLAMAQKIAAYAGRPLDYELADFHSSRPGHDLRYALDGAKLAATGWKAPLGLEESLQRTVQWSLQHPRWLGL